MDDNATCHRTLAVQDCLDSEGIQRLVWPERSPDLNPIENVWDALGRQIAGRNYPPTNKNILIRALTEEWDQLPQKLLDNVVKKQPATVENAVKGFKKCGIETHNPLVFSKQDFVTSKATDHDVVGDEIENNRANTQTLGYSNEKWTYEIALEGVAEPPNRDTKEGDFYSKLAPDCLLLLLGAAQVDRYKRALGSLVHNIAGSKLLNKMQQRTEEENFIHNSTALTSKSRKKDSSAGIDNVRPHTARLVENLLEAETLEHMEWLA
ncbi:transposable element Tcb2 transposase [Trichonephila clavipes]|nr:transposable element Tcb2 transposase [Trichonephila clavipes]